MTIRYTTIHKGWNKGILDQLLIFTVNGVIIMLLPQLGPIILEKFQRKHKLDSLGLPIKYLLYFTKYLV